MTKESDPTFTYFMDVESDPFVTHKGKRSIPKRPVRRLGFLFNRMPDSTISESKNEIITVIQPQCSFTYS